MVKLICKEHPTKVEVFLDKGVRETRQTERGNTRSGATKKREISRTLLSINIHSSVKSLCCALVQDYSEV